MSGWHGGHPGRRWRGNYYFLRLRILAKTKSSTGYPESKIFTPFSSFRSSLSFEATATRESRPDPKLLRRGIVLRLTQYSASTKTPEWGTSIHKLLLSANGPYSVIPELVWFKLIGNFSFILRRFISESTSSFQDRFWVNDLSQVHFNFRSLYPCNDLLLLM